MPKDLDTKLHSAMNFVNNFAIRALIETHPDRELLQKHFLHHVNGFVDGASQQGADPETASLVRFHADQLLDHLF